MAKIQYANKVALYNNPDIADINKVKDTDMNEIKTVVNQNADTLANKVDKISGKGLSTNDFTTTEKNKLAGIEIGAQKNPTIINNLTSASTTQPLSANQGRVLNDTKEKKPVIVTNANGTAIKYDDGTMICYHNWTQTSAIDLSYGNVFINRNPLDWTFPVPFEQLPICFCGQAQWETGASWGAVAIVEKTKVRIRAIDTVSRASGTISLLAMAIGRWK